MRESWWFTERERLPQDMAIENIGCLCDRARTGLCHDLCVHSTRIISVEAISRRSVFQKSCNVFQGIECACLFRRG